MVRSNTTRRLRGGRRKTLVNRATAIPRHLSAAVGNTVGIVAGTAGNIGKRAAKGVGNLVGSWSGHVSMAAKNTLKKRRGGRR